jgi:hypothetical protein
VDTAALAAAVQVYALYEAQSGRYTPASFAALATALASARAIVARGVAPLAEIEAAIQALREAAANLVPATDTSALEGLMEQGEDILAHAADYVATHQAALRTAIDAAAQLVANPLATQDQVLAQAIALSTAISRVLPKGDKTGLRALIGVVAGLDSARYTPNSWARLASALAAARTVEADPEAWKGEVDDAFAALQSATAGLALVAAKGGLAAAISLGATISANASAYVPASIAGLPAALTQARGVYDDGNATSAQVSAAQSALIVVIAGARLRT